MICPLELSKIHLISEIKPEKENKKFIVPLFLPFKHFLFGKQDSNQAISMFSSLAYNFHIKIKLGGLTSLLDFFGDPLGVLIEGDDTGSDIDVWAVEA